MRYVACFVLCVAAIGCAAKLSPEQTIAKEKIDEWMGPDAKQVTFVKWWPAISAEQADLPKLFADSDANTERLDMDWEMLQVMRVMYDKEKPSQIVRVRYRAKGKDEDKLFNIADGKVVAVWFPPSKECKLPWLKEWFARNFPE